MTIRSRWLVLQAAVVLLTGGAASSAHAQGRCPYLAAMQMRLHLHHMPQPMHTPHLAVPHAPLPRLTPPRMPIAGRPYPQFVPHALPHPGLSPLPHLQTPALHVRVPTVQTNFVSQTHTYAQTHLHQQLHTVRIPSLLWSQSLPGRIPSFAALQFHTSHWSSLYTTTTLTPATRLTANVKTGSRLVRFPSLSLSKRTPLLTASRPQPTGTNHSPTQRTVVAPKPEVAHVPHQITHVPAKPVMPLTPAHVTARITMTCGSCHNCKGTPKLNSTTLVTLPQVPAPRPALVPIPAPAPVTRRPELTLPNRSPITSQPFAPLVLLPVPPRMTPSSLTTDPASLTALLTPPKLLPSLGKALLTPPTLSQATSELTEVIPASPPEATLTPVLVADLNWLSPPLEQPVSSKLRTANRVELQVPMEAEKTPVAPVEEGPPLVLALLQPPPLPSGSLVAPREIIQAGLDEPPVLPALVNTLIQPPPLVPSSGE